ncbi:N-acetylneuraminate synthase family protein [Aurantivibrio plasticivorans]
MLSVEVIAEIGINHDGSVEKARELIRESAQAGVTAIKFQYRNLSNAYADTDREIGDELLLKEINRTHLEPRVIVQLCNYARELGVKPGISFFEKSDLDDFHNNMDSFDFFKLPSAELSNIELIKALLELGKHVYISTGCHEEKELEKVFKELPNTGWTPLHCVSNYPVSIKNARLGYIKYLQDKWNRDIGYSSHDDNWEVCLLALSMGATVIERHITLDKNAQGLDHSSSSTPQEFKTLCLFANNMHALTAGNIPRVPNQGELLNRQNLGRSFYTGKALSAGDTVTMDNLIYRSPNTGIDRSAIDEFIGKKVHKDVPQGAVLTKSLFEKSENISEEVLEFAQKNKLSLPVRLHDLDKFQALFPIGSFEFHLSHKEILQEIDVKQFNSNNRYSVHLPDYVNSTVLMDPFSPDEEQYKASHEILERTALFASRLQELTGFKVPVVGSFSVVHSDRELFFEQHASIVREWQSKGVDIMMQWLPPIAWYFGGAVDLHVMNQIEDVSYLKKYKLPICLDVCHLLLGKNYYGFSADELVKELLVNTGHIHIADAAGFDGEGLPIGEGESDNLDIIKSLLNNDCLKVIEVWQGHLDNGAGFKRALETLASLK